MKIPATLLTLCLLFSVCAYGKDPYGLMFTTPGQRAQLDNRFSTGRAGEADTATAANDTSAPLLKLNGTLISNTGRKEVWINGRRQFASRSGPDASVQVLAPDAVRVRPTPSTTLRPMKPGQVMDLATGEISEAYTATRQQQDR